METIADKGVFSYVASAAKSDVGRKRTNNEDAFGLFPSIGVFCVADGMGGGDDGEVASAATVRAVETLAGECVFPARAAYSAADMAAAVQAHLNDASSWILKRATDRRLKGCGSTFAGVVFDATRPESALALHAGDSRLYRIRGRSIRQMTKDHSAAELIGAKDESEINPVFRGMILRAVGIQNDVEVEVTPLSVKEGDRILICSDGLYRMVSDEEALAVVCASDGLENAAAALVAAANAAGGVDNITVVLLEVGKLPVALPVVEMPQALREEKAQPRSKGFPNARTESTNGDGGAPFDVAPHSAMTFPEAAEAEVANPRRPVGIRTKGFLVFAAALAVSCGIFAISASKRDADSSPAAIQRPATAAGAEDAKDPVVAAGAAKADELRRTDVIAEFEGACEGTVAVAFVEKVSAIIGKEMPESIYTRFRPLARGSTRSREAKCAAAVALTRDVQVVVAKLVDFSKAALKEAEARLADPSTASARRDALRADMRKKSDFLDNVGAFADLDPADPEAQAKCRLMIHSIPRWF